jgi:hypothetical protein
MPRACTISSIATCMARTKVTRPIKYKIKAMKQDQAEKHEWPAHLGDLGYEGEGDGGARNRGQEQGCALVRLLDRGRPRGLKHEVLRGHGLQRLASGVGFVHLCHRDLLRICLSFVISALLSCDRPLAQPPGVDAVSISRASRRLCQHRCVDQRSVRHRSARS